jgi:hypothetical protein
MKKYNCRISVKKQERYDFIRFLIYGNKKSISIKFIIAHEYASATEVVLASTLSLNLYNITSSLK